ncbi:uncharacterized protein LOC117340818 isoform X1 [Pecten maximus]|uniref:uncharacterized protein LOC117340818 isoform X1 n=1 Tax=Pecten maximus TaxID=6579 RepID=UPI001458243F|nr:uncharacterized protein LOC117340818 isoform X1 [Pecten maximus]
MSLSATDRKTYWTDQRESLNRIRSRLSDRDSPKRLRESPVHRDHSPYGKYRKPTSPAYLPRLDRHDRTPEGYRDDHVRGSRYGVIPPVHRREKNKSPAVDYDSWGEESDDEEEHQQPQYYMPQPLPYGYPTYVPPGGPQPVVFGPPFPMYYPPPPQYRGKNRRSKDKRRQRSPEHSKSYRNEPPLHHSIPGQDTTRYREPSVKDDVLKRYKYIYPRDSPFTPPAGETLVEQRYRGDIDSLMYFYFTDHPLFAEDTVDWLTNDLLEDIIPDLLIETFTDISKLTPSHPLHSVSANLAEEIGSEAVQDEIEAVVREAVNDMVNAHMGSKSGEDWLSAIINDRIANSVFDELLDSHVDNIKDELITNIIQEVVIEGYLEDEIIEVEVEEESAEIAHDILHRFDSKLMKKELKEVSKKAGDKLMDLFIGEQLLLLVAKQGKVWGENDLYNKIMDDFILTRLLEQYYFVRDERHKTLASKPMRKLHEKAVSEVALDVLLQQMHASLDEDLADVDEYERGVDGNQSAPATPMLPIPSTRLPLS